MILVGLGLWAGCAEPASREASPDGFSVENDPRRLDLPQVTQEEGIALRSVMLRLGSPLPSVPVSMQAPELEALRPGTSGHFLLHYQGDVEPVRRRLEALGVRVLRWLPERSLLVSVPGERAEALRAGLPGSIDLLVPYHPAWKIAPEVAALGPGDQWVGLLLHLYPGTSTEALANTLQNMGISREDVRFSQSPGVFPRAAFRLKARELVALREGLARLPEVFWLEARGQVRLFNDRAVPIVQSGLDGGGYPLAARNLYGEGQVIGILDTGLDFDSCYFRDDLLGAPPVNVGLDTVVDLGQRKVIAYNMIYSRDLPTDPTDFDSYGHGTHVAGNAAGDDPTTPLEHDSMDGVATGAKLVVQDGGFATDNCADLPALGCPVVDLQPFFAQAYAQSVRVHTNSWGDNENAAVQNNYSAGSEDVDAFAWAHPDFLLLFAAGNAGPVAGSVGSPSTAKNSLSVGGNFNGEASDTVSSFSSRGPTLDGRLKPDLLAPADNTSAGSDRNVTTNNCSRDSGAGTSYASPLVAGAAALVRQYYAEGYYPTGIPTDGAELEPTAALVKATLISSTVSLGNAPPVPSFDQGWGRVGLDTTLVFPGDLEKLVVVDRPIPFVNQTDAPIGVQVQVQSSAIPLKVTLVWTDPPSTPAAATNLVNDLDLTVKAFGRTWLGNVFRRGQSVGGGQADVLNNVEQVLLVSPRPGTYTILVTPRRLGEGPQDFALVIRGGIR